MDNIMKAAGPAYPCSVPTPEGGTATFTGMTLRDYFAAHAPMPSEERIRLEQQLDRGRNPHNDAHKPKLRETIEIVAAYKYEFADAMLEARK